MAGMEELLTLLFNALLLVFVVKLLLALFHTKIIVILLYILVLLFAMLLSGRFPDCLRLIDLLDRIGSERSRKWGKMRSKKRKGNAAARESAKEREGSSFALPAKPSPVLEGRRRPFVAQHSTATV